VHATLDDLVIALYCVVDELLGPDPAVGSRAASPGCRMPSSSAWPSPRSCWAATASTAGCGSATAASATWSLSAQPARLSQAAAAGPLAAGTGGGPPGGPDPSVHDTLRLLDATAVPCAASGQTVKRSALRGWADYGWCPSHSGWSWGLKLSVVTTADGSPVAWCLASPTLGEREVAMALLDRASLRPGQVLIVDKGLAGAEVDRHVAGLGAVLVRPDRRDEPARFGSLRPVRPWIESSIDTSRASSGWSSTAAAPWPGCMPASASGCWPWPRPSGSTGSSAPSTSAPWSPTTTDTLPIQSESII